MVRETQDCTFCRDGDVDYGEILQDFILTPNCLVIPVHFTPQDMNKAGLWRWKLYVCTEHVVNLLNFQLL